MVVNSRNIRFCIGDQVWATLYNKEQVLGEITYITPGRQTAEVEYEEYDYINSAEIPLNRLELFEETRD